jgi:DNA-directed RNA polymerase specialized sigma24 family protein
MTMKALYQHVTGDDAAHQRRIDAHVRRLNPRRQRILRRRLNATLQEIANQEGCSHGSIASVIRKSMEAIRKAIAGEPRFNRIGHPGAHPKSGTDPKTGKPAA